MNSSARLSIAMVCLAVMVQPFAYSMPRQNKDKEYKLTEKIERERNPGKRARLQIRLAKLKLNQANAAYSHRDFVEGKILMQEYLKQVRNSWATLQNTQNAIRKHVRAFMDLEISLREDDRLLRDMQRHIPYPESETIKQVAIESSAIHKQVLEVLFPDGFRHKQKSKRLVPRAGEVVAKAGAKG